MAGLVWSTLEVQSIFNEALHWKENPAWQFIEYNDLRRIWMSAPGAHATQTRLELLVMQCMGEDDSPVLLGSLIDNHLILISILAYIGWARWPQFRQKFFNIPRALDQNLSFSLVDSNDLLGSEALAAKFVEVRPIFTPVILGHQSKIQCQPSARLPMLGFQLIGNGSSGSVYSGEVMPKYIETSPGIYNDHTCNVALKCVSLEEEFKTEAAIVEDLQGYPHDHIVRCLGTIIRGGPTPSKDMAQYTIIYERASFDLKKFLEGPKKGQGISINKGAENYRHFQNFHAHHLLEQFEGIVSAVVHLHFWDHRSEGQISIAHNDIKPQNILVFEEKDHPAGLWKLADFGLASQAKFDGQLSSSDVATIASIPEDRMSISSSTYPRNPGPYCAPEIDRRGGEMKDGTQCDMWSIACVFMSTMALAAGGVQEVKVHNDSKNNDKNDRCYEPYEASPTGFRLKPKLLRWLTQLPLRYPAASVWINPSLDLVFNVFRIDRCDVESGNNISSGIIRELSGRPDAKSFLQSIHRIRHIEAEDRLKVASLLKTDSQSTGDGHKENAAVCVECCSQGNKPSRSAALAASANTLFQRIRILAEAILALLSDLNIRINIEKAIRRSGSFIRNLRIDRTPNISAQDEPVSV